MTSARLTISTASDRLRALRFNSRLSGGAKTTLPKPMPTNIQHSTQRVTDLLHTGEVDASPYSVSMRNDSALASRGLRDSYP
jgi:hypothetical protein